MAGPRSKLTRKEVKAPDEFMTWMGKAYEFLNAYRGWILIGSAAIIVLVVGGVVSSQYVETKQIDLSSVFTKEFAPVVTLWEQTELSNEGQNLQSDDIHRQKIEAAIHGLEAFYSRHKNSSIGTQALLARAAASFHGARFDEAIKAYRSYLEKDNSARWAPILWETIGNTADRAGQTEEAIAAYTEMAGSTSSLFRSIAYMHLGDLFHPDLQTEGRSLKDVVKAREYYDKALQETAVDPTARLANVTQNLIQKRLLTLR